MIALGADHAGWRLKEDIKTWLVGRGFPVTDFGTDSPDPVVLDLSGEVCPYTFLKARLALEGLAPGTGLHVIVDNEASARDVPRALAGAGHRVLSADPDGAGRWVIAVRKRDG